jgi:glycosyltransferase involved in cell wall biosynthesis
MNLIIDGTALDLYPLGKPGFHGGTELYVQKLAAGLAAKGHIVHVVCADLDTMEHRAPTLFYWGKNNFPVNADCVMMVHNLEHLEPYSADLLVLLSNGLGADLGPGDEFATGLDAVCCFSQCHIDLLTQAHPKIRPEICHITGLGVDIYDYNAPCNPDVEMCRQGGNHHGYHGAWHTLGLAASHAKVPGRMLYANDPQRGLWHVIDIFEKVQLEIPEATLHITYDWERSFNNLRWGASHMAEKFWEIDARIKANPGITSMGKLTREEMIREQLACQIHCMPSDPPNVGSQIHGITQMECAAAGSALVLSDTEAFPEVFGEAAEILPLPGWFDPRASRRWDTLDWAEEVIAIIRDPERWAAMSQRSRALAEKHTWSQVVENVGAMLAKLAKKEVAA